MLDLPGQSYSLMKAGWTGYALEMGVLLSTVGANFGGRGT